MICNHFPTNASVENGQDKRSSSVSSRSSHLGFQGVTQWDRISHFRSAAMPLRAQRKSLYFRRDGIQANNQADFGALYVFKLKIIPLKSGQRERKK